MRIKLDENLPAGLAARLQALGHDTATAPAEGLGGRLDSAVWEACQRETRFLVTQDLDFSDLRRFAPGTHAGLLLVRLREPSQRALADRVEKIFRNEDASHWERCFVVATERKLASADRRRKGVEHEVCPSGLSPPMYPHLPLGAVSAVLRASTSAFFEPAAPDGQGKPPVS